jgi:hypothetical protein
VRSHAGTTLGKLFFSKKKDQKKSHSRKTAMIKQNQMIQMISNAKVSWR